MAKKGRIRRTHLPYLRHDICRGGYTLGIGHARASGRHETSTDAEVWIRVHRRPPPLYTPTRFSAIIIKIWPKGGVYSEFNFSSLCMMYVGAGYTLELGPTEASGRKVTSTDATVWIRAHRGPPIIYTHRRPISIIITI